MEQVRTILFVSLSNIGDAILTLPSLDYLLGRFPGAEVTVVAGPRAAQVFASTPGVRRVLVYDKQADAAKNRRLLRELSKQRFDCVIDLRNSIFGLVCPARRRIPWLLKVPSRYRHMWQKHLYKTMRAAGEYPRKGLALPAALSFPDTGTGTPDVQGLLVACAPGARSHTKRWGEEKFISLLTGLAREFGASTVLLGDAQDAAICQAIARSLPGTVFDMAGKTTLPEAAAWMRRAAVVVTNDSALLHLAGYLARPVVALFGPTDEQKYGPWLAPHTAVRKDIFCRPCAKAQCRFHSLQCLSAITVETAAAAAQAALRGTAAPAQVPACKRILVARTDRIGDVLLSTPVFQALRAAYPGAYIAAMVGPHARDIVEGNPYIDEVLVYDKEKRHKGWIETVRFSARLRRMRFDTAIILHPTNRSHLVAFLAGIPRRIGYDRKMGFLLTRAFSHDKQQGEKHESEYSLDLLRKYGIPSGSPGLYMPRTAANEQWAERALGESGIFAHTPLIGVHPGASCISKQWPVERFAQAADELASRLRGKVVLVAGNADRGLAGKVAAAMSSPAVDLSGRTTVGQLASVLARCSVFISNDSGPVHVASAVGTPVVVIFGRNQKGLSPRRWGPLGPAGISLHHPPGCHPCLAHECDKGFICLKAVSVEEVVKAAAAAALPAGEARDAR